PRAANPVGCTPPPRHSAAFCALGGVRSAAAIGRLAGVAQGRRASVGETVVIRFEGLGKQYGSFVAVRGLDFSVQHGEVFGFLGPNGAGETTTIRMLMGILVPSTRHASIAGLDCQRDRIAVKRRVGYLPDVPIFYDFLRGREILQFVGEMHGQSPATA